MANKTAKKCGIKTKKCDQVLEQKVVKSTLEDVFKKFKIKECSVPLQKLDLTSKH